jgi:Tol biopolymer transport system component/predicted Ser/Thr protein kinase
MSLTPGARVGPYEIVCPLGAGGMGEVYRARDTKLDRDVALKILPESFASDPDRLMRFEREAKTLAVLNHPHIAQIYGLEERALVMELVEGEDLSQRLVRGALPLVEALPIARQITLALEAAHEAGIIHRDLKPGNIKIRTDGTVKVLDFGLAKALDQASGSGLQASGSAAANSPTFTSPALTEMGVILGTAAYMAPEQARGQAVNRRADIWAFGCILFEMLTGTRPFDGETVSDTIAAVLTRNPDWSLLPPATPPRVRRLLERCLARDRRERLRDIGDAGFDLRDEDAPAPAPSPAGRRVVAQAWLPWTVAALAVALSASWLWWRTPAAPAGPLEGHFAIELPDAAPLVTLEVPSDGEPPLAVSPNGRQVVYVAPKGSGTQLYVRAMADVIPRALPGTDGAHAPFFSPDGQWVGFFADGKLKKAPLAGGTPTPIADAPAGSGGSWSASGEIVFAAGDTTGLSVVPDSGGTPRIVSTLDYQAGEDAHRWPQLLPGGRAVIFSVYAWSRETSYVAMVDLASGARRTVQANADYARYVPDGPGAVTGHLVFVRAGALVAASFDPAGSAAAGPPTAVVEGVRDGQFDISSTGTLVYAPGTGVAPGYSLVWVDRSGEARPINDLPRGYEDLHLSPDGRQVALTVEEAGPESAAHVWLADTGRGTLTRFTFEGFSRDPVWRPDGQAIAFGSKRGDDEYGIYVKPLDGRSPAELLWASPIPIWPDPGSWTPDGRTLVFATTARDTGDDIWTVTTDTHVAAPWLQTPANEVEPRLSPDGRWLAYNSDESGRWELYVRPFPGPGDEWLVSQGGGGFNAIWTRDGRQIVFRRGSEFLAVDVDTSAGFAISTPRVLFSGRYRGSGRDFDVSPDGTRFVAMRNDDARTTDRMGVVLDWWRALAARTGTEVGR